MKSQIVSTTKDWPGKFCYADERADANDPPVHIRWYAGKEAVVKALGTAFGGDTT